MKKLLLLASLLPALTISAQTDSVEITTTTAKSMYKSYGMGRVSVHDPSVVYNSDKNAYYIFGSHRGQAKTTNFQSWNSFTAPWGKVNSDGTVTSCSNQEAFTTNQVKTITIGGKTVDFGNFDVHAWAAMGTADGTYSVDGMMWAPDIIYNEAMKKWCMYLSVNGDYWMSSIILLTSDEIDGTYVYQGPVVFSGFRSSNIDWKLTDLELVIGEQSSLPSRYNKGGKWGSYWPNCIDPCVLYDEDGQLWMSYGSWSGGIWLIKLNNETGLRDYDTTYSSDFSTKDAACTYDPYFGKRIAGGYYCSGEGSYIEHIGDYYYLFVTNGGLTSDGGYDMRVFRSKTIDGTYLGPTGADAHYTSYKMNYGKNGDTRGEKVVGAYDEWGFMTVGELAQGHNSIIHTKDDQNLLVYHTRFNDGTEGHQVRCHQTFVNQAGWLVVAPFEYHNETLTDEQVKTTQPFTTDEILGTYNLLVHKYSMDYANKEVCTPKKITLYADGTVKGDYTGKWEIVEGTSYINITLSNSKYQGVISEQQMDGYNIKAVCFTAANGAGVNIWGYKMRDDYALAYQLNNTTMPISNRKKVSANINLEIEAYDNVNVAWTSSNPEIFSNTGKYNPEGLTENDTINLNLHITSGKYYYDRDFTVIVMADTVTTGDFKTGMIAYYGFNEAGSTTSHKNAFNEEERAYRLNQTGGTKPTLETDSERDGNFIHQYESESGKTSYTRIVNPLCDADIDEGITISFWVKRLSDDKWKDIFTFYDTATKNILYMTGNTYFRYYEDDNNYLDLNNPSTISLSSIPTDSWALVTITISKTDGYTIYVNKNSKAASRYAGAVNGEKFTNKANFDFSKIIDHIKACKHLYFGYGTEYGSAPICYDDLIIYNRVLSKDDVARLYQMETRVFDFSELATQGISEILYDGNNMNAKKGIYDLSGRKIENPTKGLYIINGKKVVIK